MLTKMPSRTAQELYPSLHSAVQNAAAKWQLRTNVTGSVYMHYSVPSLRKGKPASGSRLCLRATDSMLLGVGLASTESLKRKWTLIFGLGTSVAFLLMLRRAAFGEY